MREEAAETEWRRWKRESPDKVEFLRWCVRQYCDGMLKEDPEWVPNAGNQLVRFLKDLDIEDEYVKIKPHCYVTVRVPQVETIESVYKKIKGLRYTWLEGAEAVIEDFGTENPHFHLLIPRKIHKGNIIKQLSNRFRVPKPSVDYLQSDSPERYEQLTNYIRGRKKAAKMPKVEADVAYRNAHNIPHLISF